MQRSILPAVLAKALVKQAAGIGLSTGNPYKMPNPFRSDLLTPIPKSILTPARSVWSGQAIKPKPGPHADIIQPPETQGLPPAPKPATVGALAKPYPWAVMYQNPRDPEGAIQKAVSGN